MTQVYEEKNNKMESFYFLLNYFKQCIHQYKDAWYKINGSIFLQGKIYFIKKSVLFTVLMFNKKCSKSHIKIFSTFSETY